MSLQRADSPPALPQDTARTETTLESTHCTGVRNPDYAAVPAIHNTEEALTKLFEHIQQNERDGDINELCTACDNRADDFCNGCKHARYCSLTCQISDWSIHKRFCKDLAHTVADASRPSPEHVRILCFPLSNTRPQLQWAETKGTGSSGKGLTFDQPELPMFTLLANYPDRAEGPSFEVLNLLHRLGGRRVGHGLTAIKYTLRQAQSAVDCARLLNRCINALSKPGYLRCWVGPVAVFAETRPPGGLTAHRLLDISPRDITTIVRLLQSTECVCVADPAVYLGGEVIQGLRINDLQVELNVALGVDCEFDPTLVPLAPASTQDHPVALAFYLGLRWYIRPGNFCIANNHAAWKDGNLRYLSCICLIYRENSVNGNDAGDADDSSLNAVCDYAPYGAGVILLHGSGKAVDVHHVLAFNAFLDKVFDQDREFSEGEFRKFWDEYKQALGHPGTAVPSPYCWEEVGVKDKLGIFDAKYVRKQVVESINTIRPIIEKNIGRHSTETRNARGG